MELSRLKWIKNIRHRGNDKQWAYEKAEDMAVPEAKILRLDWRSAEKEENASSPQKGDLMLLLQRARVTHLVELIDDKLYRRKNAEEWSIYRIVQVQWMPLEDSDWYQLPHQREFFGFDDLPQDGDVHDLSTEYRMSQFHRYWDEKGGLAAFQKHVANQIAQLASKAE